MKRRWMTRADLWVLLCVLLLSLALFFLARQRETGDTVSVFVENDLYASFSLADAPASYTVKTERGSLFLSFDGDGVRVLHADCPDGVCVRTGKAHRLGESIVCVPLGVCITVGDSALDGVTG